MCKPDIESLRKWRKSLEEQREQLDEMIAACNKQLEYFDRTQIEFLVKELPSNSPGKAQLGQAIINVLMRGAGRAISKDEIIEELKIAGFSVEESWFMPALNGYLGAHVRNHRVLKAETGRFVIAT